jgi:hypothetical protein
VKYFRWFHTIFILLQLDNFTSLIVLEGKYGYDPYVSIKPGYFTILNFQFNVQKFECESALPVRT